MALFRRKKSESDQAKDGSVDTASEDMDAFQPQPEKARKWFDHAKSMAERFSYDSALYYYANGIKLDPESMSAHEAMHEVAIKYMNKGGKAASSREIKKIDDGTPISRFAAAEFAWTKDYRNASLALKSLETAAKAEQYEYALWIAPKVLNLLRNQKKPSKNQLAQMKEICKTVGAWDEAISAGETLLQLEPSNSQLAHELKDMAAQRAMDQGGYEEAAGQEGGFRRFIKDADKQRELIESESISGGDTVQDRNLARAKEAYDEAPTVPDVINQYATLLRKQGTPESIKAAYKVFMKGYEDTKEYRFRMLAGDIKIEEMKRRIRKLREKSKENPEDTSAREEFEQAKSELLQTQSKEYNERVAKYPTDRHRKFELGVVEYELGNVENAMAQFQSSKDEPKLRVRAGHMLGKCFAREEWHPEAVAEFREALAALDATEKDRELEIRYDLMASLIEQAKSEESLDVAKEALEICSGIARRNITYRDIRNKRKEIDTLVKELSASDRSSGSSESGSNGN